MRAAVIGGRTFEWGRRVHVMGIVNVTPDSFSGDGLAGRPDAAVEQGLRMEEAGADMLDVGGESTRPGFTPVGEEEELARVLPVVEQLARRASVPVSIDTTKYVVAKAALEAGAAAVNDVWGLQREPRLAELAARHDAAVVAMHNHEGTEYADLMRELAAFLRRSSEVAAAAGVPPERVILDPGIGFGKTAQQNLEVMRRLDELRRLDRPLLIGVSRKSYLGRVFGHSMEDRLMGTAASVVASVLRGVDVVRVHDVPEMVRAVRVAEALR